MHLRYDEDLVEAAVFLCVAGRHPRIPSLQIVRFNRERERLYDIIDPDGRNAAFFRLHLEWFREWGLEQLLTVPLKEFSLLREGLRLLAFRKSRTKADEGAELYVNEAGERSGVVAIQPERLKRELGLAAFLRHELTHLQDMVDPGFGYRPELPVTGPSLNQHRLARERYQRLWDITIDGRLARSGRDTIITKEQRWLEFSGAFVFWTQTRREEVFRALWTSPAPTHRMLEELTCDPSLLQIADAPHPGSPCPLCGFPTFAWATAANLADHTVAAIRSEFPQWVPEQGVCGRCSEIYRAKRLPVMLRV
ncbi:MAG TPA: hypothetical protein VJA21_11950 [Verrucomicrobiae bacterium]